MNQPEQTLRQMAFDSHNWVSFLFKTTPRRSSRCLTARSQATQHLASEARKMANHADTRTSQLYGRCGDTASLDEYGKVGI